MKENARIYSRKNKLSLTKKTVAVFNKTQPNNQEAITTLTIVTSI